MAETVTVEEELARVKAKVLRLRQELRNRNEHDAYRTARALREAKSGRGECDHCTYVAIVRICTRKTLLNFCTKHADEHFEHRQKHAKLDPS